MKFEYLLRYSSLNKVQPKLCFKKMTQNPTPGEIKSSSDYLVRWSEYDHSAYCLALCFTYRDFESGVLGLAYVGAKGGCLS